MENAPRANSRTVTLRRMTAPDVPAVIAIERASFNVGWPATAFERELSQNQMARYIVLEGDDPGTVDGLVGFAGLWLMVEEAHVVTVAVVPEQRGRGLGRLLVHALVAMAHDSGMTAATLECRVSNAAARALYGSYGFYEVGTRKRYYSDNHEDAIIMTTESLATTSYIERYARLEAKLEALLPGVRTKVSD